MKRTILALALVLAASGQAYAFRFAVGMYSGNGADNRNISVSPSFAIDAMFIKCQSNQMVARTSTMPGDLTDQLATGGATTTNIIQSLGTGTFQVGSSSMANASGTDNCFYVAFGLDANNDLSVEVDDTDDGSYLGNGVDARGITILPAFQPIAVFILGEISAANSWRTADTGTGSLRYNAESNATNHIQALNADGFEVGTSTVVNDGTGGTVDYWPISVKAISGFVASGSYVANTGTCADDCSVNVGFQPDFVLLKGNDTNEPAVFRTSAMTGDFSCRTTAVTCTTGGIQAFNGSGFEYGQQTFVNTNGITYYWLAIKIPVYAGSTQRRSQTIGVE